MANTIAHIVVASLIIKEFPLLVNDKKAYFLGTVATDSIASKDNYSKLDKKYVHLRKDIRDKNWLNVEEYSLFRERINQFVDKYINNTYGSQKDFNIGYLVHLLVDEMNHRTIRKKMLKILEPLNIKEEEQEFYYCMINDLEALDNYLLESKNISNILNDIFSMDISFPLNEYIEKEYIIRSIKWWKNDYLISIKNKELKYISISDIEDFILKSKEKIIDEISCLQVVSN